MNSQYKTSIYALQPLLIRQKEKQHGVVLFIALIALVVMSLAAVALIRSVDTSTIIAGNLATKQSATISADSGIDTALTWMGSATPATFNTSNAAQGYYATHEADPTTFAWDATDSLPADDVSGNIDANGTDASGNTTRYIIQRMCRATGDPAAGNCLFGASADPGSSQNVKDEPKACGDGGCASTDPSPMYRVTARVTSAKNTISYIQAFIY